MTRAGRRERQWVEADTDGTARTVPALLMRVQVEVPGHEHEHDMDWGSLVFRLERGTGQYQMGLGRLLVTGPFLVSLSSVFGRGEREGEEQRIEVWGGGSANC